MELYSGFLGGGAGYSHWFLNYEMSVQNKENKKILIYRDEPNGSTVRTGYSARLPGALHELGQVISDFRALVPQSIETATLLGVAERGN